MKMDRILVWSSDVDVEDWREDLTAEYPDMSEDELYREACEINYSYLEDERRNLSCLTGEPIIVIGDLGFWFGRRNGYKMVQSGAVSDLLYSEKDFAEWYVDEKGEFRANVADHDGSSSYLYRRLRSGLSEKQIQNFESKILQGKADTKVLNRYTTKVGMEILHVYGLRWVNV